MKRVIVIAATKAEGRARRSPGYLNVAIVTPRSPHAARGVVADVLDVAEGIERDPRLPQLLDEVRPCFATTRDRDQGWTDHRAHVEAGSPDLDSGCIWCDRWMHDLEVASGLVPSEPCS